MLYSPPKFRSFESAIKSATDLQISTHQLQFERDPIGERHLRDKFPILTFHDLPPAWNGQGKSRALLS